MTKLLIALSLLVVLVIVVRVLEMVLRGKKSVFDYSRRDSIMTPAERECFAALTAEMGMTYHSFPQVHLDSLVQSKNSHRRFQAFRHINQISVDFVACDRSTLRPVFVIELDDKSHNQPRRIERDQEVERILNGAGLPLVRIENRGRIDPKALVQFVQRGLQEKTSLAA